ncbi:hypothetical protein E5288_WYG019964 [Bos mutus]|uniref:Uncharacterized protein n=1 Tax=Bos mutus TaxID=72004 RepID=A0A6B0RHW7_9CETA|nr:hypothetical protein [Bos mutus]
MAIAPSLPAATSIYCRPGGRPRSTCRYPSASVLGKQMTGQRLRRGYLRGSLLPAYLELLLWLEREAGCVLFRSSKDTSPSHKGQCGLGG